MGSSKAELPFGGMRMIDYQVQRLISLGIEDIVVAGRAGEVSGARCVPDERAYLGPLGGLKSGLAAAKNNKCLVLSVDAPLVPFAVLFELMRRHRSGITIAEHGGQLEPLIGIYDRSLTDDCAALLNTARTSVRRLFDKASFQALHFEIDPLLLSNCNTPEEYARMIAFS
jgi:molybdopterin-guanine dinucleotide biosynthesis protein A